MKKIRAKLLLSNTFVVLLSILLISVPILISQVKEIKENIETVANAQMQQAANAIDSFLDKPGILAKDASRYALRSNLDQKQGEKDFEFMLGGDPSLFCLYFADTVPMNKGGRFVSSDGWIPDNDYNKETRDWYAAAVKASDLVLTDPYVDETTGDLCATVAYGVREGGFLRGVTAVDIMLSSMQTLIENLRLSKGGQSYIIDENGIYLTNADASKITKTNFFDAAFFSVPS